MRMIARLGRIGLMGAASAVSLLGGAGGAWAQARTQAQAEDDNTIPAIVVTAQKRSENIQTVPITMQAVTGEQAKKLGLTESADIGRITPNVDVTQPGGEGTITIVMIRGIGLNDYSANNSGPNGVYVDEVYLSAPVAQSFRPFDLERVEVLMGPQGTLYGRNTSGGAINYITTKPSETFSARLNTSYSSFNNLNLDGAVGGRLADGLSGRLAVNYDKSDGFFHDTTTGERANGNRSLAARGMLNWRPTDRLKVLLSANIARVDTPSTIYRHVGTLDPATGSQCATSAVLAGSCVDLYGTPTTPGYYDGTVGRRGHTKARTWGGSVRVDYDLTDDIALTSLTSYVHTYRFIPEDSDGSALGLISADYLTSSNTATQELRLAQNTAKYSWVAGGYFLGERLALDTPISLFEDFDLVYGPGSGDGITQRAFSGSLQRTKAYALFGQGDYNLTDKLKLTVGARYSYEDRKFAYHQSSQYQQGGMGSWAALTTLPLFERGVKDDGFSYRLAVNYNLTDRIMLYASNATGFKSGAFNGSFLSTDPVEVGRQLNPVKSEHVKAYETGFKSTWLDRRLVVNLALFYNDYRDLQVFTPINSPVAGNPPVNVLDNAPKAHTQGVDLQVTAAPFKGLTLTQNVGFLEAKLDRYSALLAAGTPDYSGNRLPLAPRVTSSSVVQYGFAAGPGRADLMASASYKSRTYLDTTNDPLIAQKSYWLVNARAAYSVRRDSGEWEVAAFARNLLRKKYLAGGSNLSEPFGLIELVVAEPRSVGIELNWKY